MKGLPALFFFLCSVSVFADSPMEGLPVEGFAETSGYALVEGEQLHFYLYSTNDNSDFDIFQGLVFFWAERQGFIIDYDNSWAFDPNNNLASSVIRLMESRLADISVTIHNNCLYIHIYMGTNISNRRMEEKNYFSTAMYPLVRVR